MKTWETNMTPTEVKVIDYSNIHEYLPNCHFNLDNLKKYPLSVQKDAIQAAVLLQNGGMFIDADMILTRPIHDLLQKSENYDFVLFGYHLALTIAKKNSPFVKKWFEKSLKKVNDEFNENASWDYFGNSITNKLINSNKYSIWSIDVIRSAYTPENNHFLNLISPYHAYQKFWFSSTMTIDKVFFNDQNIIALHNTWTPEYYRSMKSSDIMIHNSLLSRTLDTILKGDAIENYRTVGPHQIMIWFFMKKFRGLMRRLGFQ